MSLYPSWQPGYHVSCCSIWSDFGSGSDCLSHPSQISVDPNVWVLKSTTCFLMRCQGDTLQEQRTRGRERRPRCRGERLLLHWCFFFFSFKSRCCERENTWHWIYSKHFHVFSTYINSISSRKKKKKKETVLWENQYCLTELCGGGWMIVTNFTGYETI